MRGFFNRTLTALCLAIGACAGVGPSRAADAPVDGLNAPVRWVDADAAKAGIGLDADAVAAATASKPEPAPFGLTGDWNAPAIDANAAAAADIDAEAPSFRRGQVKIGGRAWMAVYAGRYDAAMPSTDSYADPAAGERADLPALWSEHNRKRHTTDFSAKRMELEMEVAAAENASVHLRLDLDDAWDRTFDQDDFLHSLYFELREIWGRPLELRLGKQTLPFGARRDDLLLGPYIADADECGFSGWLNAPAADMDEYHPPAADRSFALVAEWRPKFMRDLLILEGGIFQDRRGRGQNARRRSQDDLLFRSYVGRMRFSPFEKMELSLSFLNRHNDGAQGRRDNRAWSVGLSSPLFVAPVTLFAEYQRSWRDGFVSGQDAQNLHAGAVWDLAWNTRLHLQGEWLKIDRDANATTTGAREEARFFRTLAALEYELKSGIVLEGGWQREWYKRRGRYYSSDPSLAGVNLARFHARGDVFYLGVKYDF